MATRHVALFLALAAAHSAAAPEDTLIDAIGDAAKRLALTLNGLAAEETEPLVVAVRPGRMKFGERYVHCPALGNDLRDILRARLEDLRRHGKLGFEVMATDGGVAVAEVNTEWRHDVSDGTDVMRAMLKVKVATT